MIVTTVRTRSILRRHRLDAQYFLSPGVEAEERLVLLKARGARAQTLGGPGGLGTVSALGRSRRVYAAAGEPSIPYLRPYDIFDYLPVAADQLSAKLEYGVSNLMPNSGTILQTCSGRNLGPLAYADKYLSRFAVSDDMLRVKIDDMNHRMYALAYLSTPTGQSLLRRNKTGAVIDHLSPEDLSQVEVVFVPDSIMYCVINDIKQAVSRREKARLVLAESVAAFENSLPAPKRGNPLSRGWTQHTRSLTSRIDAAYYDPLVNQVQKELRSVGGSRCEASAAAFVPPRYIRNYVSASYGRPVMSGRQLLQAKPINLRYISVQGIDASEYELHKNWLAFGMEGRAEERIAIPALINAERDRWLASEHVMRVIPRKNVGAGELYLAFACWQTQIQVRACSCGSVIDEVSPRDLLSVVLPPFDADLGQAVESAWSELSNANISENEAIRLLETALRDV
jgi:hypothetical protein